MRVIQTEIESMLLDELLIFQVIRSWFVKLTLIVVERQAVR